jgi:hypothetical protein
MPYTAAAAAAGVPCQPGASSRIRLAGPPHPPHPPPPHPHPPPHPTGMVRPRVAGAHKGGGAPAGGSAFATAMARSPRPPSHRHVATVARAHTNTREWREVQPRWRRALRALRR